MKKFAWIMVLRLILVLLIIVSSNQILLFSKLVRITNVFNILASTRIIKMVKLNSQSSQSLKWPMSLCFPCLFSGKMALVQTCVQWILVMPHLFTITCPILKILRLIISSLELNFPVTSLNIYTCGVVLSTYWIPRFNKVVNYRNVSHDLVA